jgi:hypothetical protein
MGGDNRSVLDHVCCLPSGNAIVVWAMGTTASSTPGAGCMGRRTMSGDERSVLDHVCCLPSGDASVDVGEPSVSFEEIVTTASSMPGTGCVSRTTMGGNNRSVLDHEFCLPSGDATVDVGQPSVDFEEMGTTGSSMRLCESQARG